MYESSKTTTSSPMREITVSAECTKSVGEIDVDYKFAVECTAADLTESERLLVRSHSVVADLLQSVAKRGEDSETDEGQP